MKNNIKIGEEITLIGKYEKLKNSFVASDIKLDKIDNNSIEPIYHSSKEIKNKNLIKQRDLLLPRLMSGKLEVK